jgi:hypothetical protein
MYLQRRRFIGRRTEEAVGDGMGSFYGADGVLEREEE